MKFVKVLEKCLRVEWGSENAAVQSMVEKIEGRVSLREIIDSIPAAHVNIPPLALLSFDVDKIKEYVFATSKPLEIKGASAIVEDLTKSGADMLVQWISTATAGAVDENNIIFAGGGTGLILVPASLAEKVKETIEREFVRFTVTGTCSVVYEKFFPHELMYGQGAGKLNFNQKGRKLTRYLQTGYLSALSNGSPVPFGNIVDILSAKLRREKDMKVSGLLSPVHGIIKRCDSCLSLPADPYNPDKRKNRLCLSCLKKREIARKRKKEECEGLSFDDLVRGLEYRRDYIAAVYADANNMGNILSQIRGPDEYRLFSDKVQGAFSGAVDKVRNHLKLADHYNSLVTGGDDIFLILPAERAIQAIEVLINEVKANFRNTTPMSEELGDKLKKVGLSVGLVITPKHYPAKFLIDYTGELLKSAKKKAYHAEPPAFAIDFMVIKDSSPLSLSIENARKAAYEKKAGPSRKFYLHKRPYLFDEFQKYILAPSKSLRQVPNSQIHKVINLLLNESPEAAELNILYQAIRSDEWKKFLGEKMRVSQTKWGDFFIHQDTHYHTSFIDLVELTEMTGWGYSKGGKN